MSERFTTIDLPGIQSWSERGNIDVDRMIAIYQDNARRNLDQAMTIRMAAPSDFRVIQHNGVFAWRNVRILQNGRTAPPPF